MKRIISMVLSVFMLVNIFYFAPISNTTAYADDYAASLRSKGFPESYIQSLVALHNKYPNWIFEPLKTNLDFNTAVQKERSYHKKQLIQKYSGNDSSMYCNCSNCYRNGNYVIQEGGGWVSASEKAVAYYMDPRNFLNEKGIFQFESMFYNGTQTKAGIEAILNGTWMHDSLISYHNTSGDYVTNRSTKYSDAIMEAANDSGMGAFYLASKIKQEVGGSKPTAGGASGTVSPYQGIYNYYNIGATTGALDGLDWAAGYLRTSKPTTMYSNYNGSTGKVEGTQTQLAEKQYMTWRDTFGPYYYVRLYDDATKKEGKSGFVLKSDLRTTYTGNTSTGWGRPWFAPDISIYYGAKYIAYKFKTQYTGYLQKFNVNPASGSDMFSNEYMANVQAAASESNSTYTAYNNTGLIQITKTFYIPVYNNMPGQWIKSGDKWWYRHADCTYSKNAWELIDGKWYHFDDKGWMQTGWLKTGGNWFYLGTDGIMQTGWRKIKDIWYYMNSSGVMLKGWNKINNLWYYMDGSGAMQTGWKKINNLWYYMNDSGVMQTGWRKLNNEWYYMNGSGVMLTGWQAIGGDWYFFKGSGAMCHDEYVGDYYLDENGRWVQ